MTQEDKKLLLKDLCARLPYGVKVLCMRDFNYEWYNLEMVDIGDDEVYVTTYEPYTNRYVKIEEVKPYLFPLSSMTEEQEKEFALLQTSACKEGFLYVWNCATMMKWLIENHFDYNNLIPKGLANDATGLNIY